MRCLFELRSFAFFAKISRQLRYKRALRASQTYSFVSPILRLSYQRSIARINNLYLIIYRLIALYMLQMWLYRCNRIKTKGKE